MSKKIYLSENLAIYDPARNQQFNSGMATTGDIDIAEWITESIADGTITVPGGGGGVTDGDKGDITVSGSGSVYTIDAAVVTSGKLATDSVVSSKIAAGSVTNAKLASAPNATIKGNVSGSTATPTDLTATEVTTIVNSMIGADGTNPGLKGLVPQPSATDNTKYLRGDGTWQTVGSGSTTNTLVGTSSTIISTVNGVAATLTPTSGTIAQNIGFDSSGNVVKQAPSGGGSPSISTYSAGNGALVSATDTGVTFVRTTASVWAFSVPSGVRLLSFNIYTASASNPGAAVDIAFNYVSNTVTNQGNSTAEIPSWSVMQNAGAGFNQITVGSGATSFKPNAFTAASGNLSFTGIQMGNAASGDVIIKGNF